MRDGSGWSASLYNQSARFVYSSEYTGAVLSLLDAQPGQRIIDFGCGSGELTLDIQEAVEHGDGGFVCGLDYSESMVRASAWGCNIASIRCSCQIRKAKENGLKQAFQVDIQNPDEVEAVVSETGSKFDVVFTNAALHWCKRDPAGVLESAKRVLKPGGRIVGEMGGFLNCIGEVPALRWERVLMERRQGVRSAIHRALRERGYDPESVDPWYFPSMEDYVKVSRVYL